MLTGCGLTLIIWCARATMSSRSGSRAVGRCRGGLHSLSPAARDGSPPVRRDRRVLRHNGLTLAALCKSVYPAAARSRAQFDRVSPSADDGPRCCRAKHTMSLTTFTRTHEPSRRVGGISRAADRSRPTAMSQLAWRRSSGRPCHTHARELLERSSAREHIVHASRSLLWARSGPSVSARAPVLVPNSLGLA